MIRSILTRLIFDRRKSNAMVPNADSDAYLDAVITGSGYFCTLRKEGFN